MKLKGRLDIRYLNINQSGSSLELKSFIIIEISHWWVRIYFKLYFFWLWR